MGEPSSVTSVIRSINATRDTIVTLVGYRISSRDDLKTTGEQLGRLRAAIQQYASKENRIYVFRATPMRVLAEMKLSADIISSIDAILADYKCNRIGWIPEGRADMVKLWQNLGASKSEWDSLSKLCDEAIRLQQLFEKKPVLLPYFQSGERRKEQRAIEPPPAPGARPPPR